MRRVNEVNADTVVMPEQQRDSACKGIATRHYLSIRNAATDIRKRREQHAGIYTVGNLRCR